MLGLGVTTLMTFHSNVGAVEHVVPASRADVTNSHPLPSACMVAREDKNTEGTEPATTVSSTDVDELRGPGSAMTVSVIVQVPGLRDPDESVRTEVSVDHMRCAMSLLAAKQSFPRSSTHAHKKMTPRAEPAMDAVASSVCVCVCEMVRLPPAMTAWRRGGSISTWISCDADTCEVFDMDNVTRTSISKDEMPVSSSGGT
jgi:hypothetical protein